MKADFKAGDKVVVKGKNEVCEIIEIFGHHAFIQTKDGRKHVSLNKLLRAG